MSISTTNYRPETAGISSPGHGRVVKAAPGGGSTVMFQGGGGGGGGSVNLESPVRVPHVHSVVGNLDHAVQDAMEVAKGLRERLSQVLREPDSDVSAFRAVRESGEGRPPLALALERQVDEIHSLAALLRDVLDRLEV